MKKFYTRFSYVMILTGSLAMASCQKGGGDDAVSDSITRKLTVNSPEYQAVVRNAQFLGACEVLTADGEMIDSNSAIYAAKNGSYEVSFAVVNEVSGKPGVYQKLIFAADHGKTFVYFDEKNPADTSVTGSQKLKLPPSWWPGGGGSGGSGGGSGGGNGMGFCWQWNPWVTTSYSCNYSFSCFFNNQQAKFANQQRTCKNNPWNVQTRTVKLHCGC